MATQKRKKKTRSTRKKAVGRPRKKKTSATRTAVRKKTRKKKAKKKAARRATSAASRKKRVVRKKRGSKKKAKKKTSAARGKQASKTSLPRKGAKVQWRALPGMVSGTVVAILTKDAMFQGKKVKASKEEPRIKLRSDRGKLCVHKPSSLKPAK